MSGGHAQFCCPLIHHLHKGRLAAPYEFRHRHSGIVGAGHTDGLEHIVERHLFARFQPDLTAAHAVGMFADRYHIIQMDFPLFQCLECQKQGHHLGDGGNGPLFIRIFFVQHRTRILIHQDRRLTRQIKITGPRRCDGLHCRLIFCRNHLG